MKISEQDFNKYIFYYEDDFSVVYSKSKETRHKLVAKDGDDSWTIIPFGTQREEYLDRAMYFGDGLTWINNIDKLPAWLPKLPLEIEVSAVKSINWADRLAENPKFHTFDKYMYIYEYFTKNSINELEIFLKFKTEEFDGFNTEPIYTYIDEVYLSKTAETTKSETIIMNEKNFDIPNINAEYPEKYKVSDILWRLDNSFFIDKFRVFKNDAKRAFLQNKSKQEKLFEFINAEKDWIPIALDSDIYLKLIKIFSDDSIDFDNEIRKLNGNEYSRLIYYKEFRREYLN